MKDIILAYIKNIRLHKYQADVSAGPHSKGSPLLSQEKKCIVNLYQSYVNEGKPEKEAREETARRLQFGQHSVENAIKEMLSEGNVHNNKPVRIIPNAFEKLAQEEIDDPGA